VPENEDETMDITADSTEVIWNTAFDASGKVDTDVSYNMWLVTDYDDLENSEPTVEAFKPEVENYVFEKTEAGLTNNVVAYKYTFNNLNANTVYYFKITANKEFIVAEDDEIKIETFSSEPAVKVIQTEPGNNTVPISLYKPHIRIKTNEDGEYAIGEESATIEWDTCWEEYFNDEGVWELLTPEIEDTVTEDVYDTRELVYDSDIKFTIGYMELTDDMNYDDIRTIDTQIMDIENPYSEDESGVIEHTIEDLEPNKSYIVWVKSYRDESRMSEPSDLLIVTTKIENTMPLEKPPAIKLNYYDSLENNEGIELGWDRSIEREDISYTYNLKWSETDDINMAVNEATIDEDYFLVRDTYLLSDLNPETLYYFWLQVEISRDNETQVSNWGESVAIKTTMYTLPDIPSGFGIKMDEESLGANYITYIWNEVEDASYILEICDNQNFENSIKYDTDEIEYKVEELNSNSWYYARVYSYDSERELTSFPSDTISVKTLKSDAEYDSDTSNDSEITGPLEEDSYDSYNDIWTKEITGVNTARVIEEVISSDVAVYEINLEEEPDGYGDIDVKRLILGYDLISGLSNYKKDILILNGEKGEYLIRPRMLEINDIISRFDSTDDIKIYINIYDEINNTEDYSLYIDSLEQVEISISFTDEIIFVPVNEFNTPLKVVMPIEDLYLYSTVSGAILEKGKWEKLSSQVKVESNDNDDGIVVFETSNAGVLGIINENKSMRFSDLSYHYSKNDILLLYETYDLKSLSEDTMFYPEADYSDKNIIELAYKADMTDMSNVNGEISKQEISKILARVYEIKTGNRIKSYNGILDQYTDNYKISEIYKEYMEFVVYKGLILLGSEDKLEPEQLITRADSMIMLKRTLEKAGDL
jgi:hypothetical protein